MKIIQILSSFFLVFSIVIIVFSGSAILFPHWYKPWNNYLEDISNIIFCATMIFAAFAVLIASMALKTSILRPNLKLRIGTWLYEKEGLALLVDPKSRVVSNSVPLTSWRIWLENHGYVSAKYPMVQIVFNGAYFTEDAFPGWNAVYHEHAFGWYGFQWSPGNDTIIYQGLPVQLPTMYFSGKQIGEPGLVKTETEDTLEIEISVVADGNKKSTFTIPIILEYENIDN